MHIPTIIEYFEMDCFYEEKFACAIPQQLARVVEVEILCPVCGHLHTYSYYGVDEYGKDLFEVSSEKWKKNNRYDQIRVRS